MSAPQQLINWLDQAFSVAAGCAAAGGVAERAAAERCAAEQAVGAIARLQSALDAQRLVCASLIARTSADPKADLAASMRSDRRDAATTMDRVDTVTRAPALAEALGQGAIAAGHVDRFGGALRRLEADQQAQLLEQLPTLVTIAQQTTPGEFDRRLRCIERGLRTDGGENLLATQRAAVRHTSWTDRESGMHHWRLDLDPRTAVTLDSQLRAVVEAMFHGGDLPPEAPSHPLERQSFLRAQAVIAMLQGKGPKLGRPEIVVVVDTRVPQGAEPVVDWGMDVDLPLTELLALAARAKVSTVAMSGDRVVAAPGNLARGRTTRLASADQRRVLRAVYATCAVPGCEVRFDDCTIHHVIWWRRGGRTDLDNLVPLCTAHHHDVHDRGWEASLRRYHQLRIRLPDGTQRAGGPNRIERTRARCRAGP